MKFKNIIFLNVNKMNKNQNDNQTYQNVYISLISFGISRNTAESIAKYSSISRFYHKNVHIAYTRIGNREIWCMNQKKTDLESHRKSSEHAEEALVKKINRSFFRKQIKHPITMYSIRINRLGVIKCAKPCRDCMRYIINSKIKIKNIIWIEYDFSGDMTVVSQNIAKSDLQHHGVSSGRRWNHTS